MPSSKRARLPRAPRQVWARQSRDMAACDRLLQRTFILTKSHLSSCVFWARVNEGVPVMLGVGGRYTSCEIYDWLARPLKPKVDVCGTRRVARGPMPTGLVAAVWVGAASVGTHLGEGFRPETRQWGLVPRTWLQPCSQFTGGPAGDGLAPAACQRGVGGHRPSHSPHEPAHAHPSQGQPPLSLQPLTLPTCARR